MYQKPGCSYLFLFWIVDWLHYQKPTTHSYKEVFLVLIWKYGQFIQWQFFNAILSLLSLINPNSTITVTTGISVAEQQCRWKHFTVLWNAAFLIMPSLPVLTHYSILSLATYLLNCNFHCVVISKAHVLKIASISWHHNFKSNHMSSFFDTHPFPLSRKMKSSYKGIK